MIVDFLNRMIDNHPFYFVAITITTLFFITVIIRGWPNNDEDDNDDEEEEDDLSGKYLVTISNTTEINNLLNEINELIVSVERLKNE